jgi:hypothetical protein
MAALRAMLALKMAPKPASKSMKASSMLARRLGGMSDNARIRSFSSSLVLLALRGILGPARLAP